MGCTWIRLNAPCWESPRILWQYYDDDEEDDDDTVAAEAQGFVPSSSIFPFHKHVAIWEIEQLGQEWVPKKVALAPQVEAQVLCHHASPITSYDIKQTPLLFYFTQDFLYLPIILSGC